MPTLPHRTSTDLQVLHSLRCIGFVPASRITAATDLPGSEVDSILDDLRASGLVTHDRGPFGGWGLSEAGRTADAERIAEELAMTGTRPAITTAYDGFLALNPELLDLCSAWLTRPDQKVLDLLTDFHHRADPVLTALSSALLRFDRYRTRLTEAVEHVRSGEHAYFTEDVESYHSVWFQLHEDLLATLGIPRH